MGFQKSIYQFLIPLTGILFTAIGCQIYYPYEPFIRTLQPDFAHLTADSSANSKCKVAVFFIEDFDFCDCGGFRELMHKFEPLVLITLTLAISTMYINLQRKFNP